MGDNSPGITMTKMSVSVLLQVLALTAIAIAGFTLMAGHHRISAGVLENEATINEEADIRKYRQSYVSGVDVYKEVRNHLNDGLGIYICNSQMRGNNTLFGPQTCQVYGYLPTSAANNVTQVTYVDGRFQVPDLSGEYNTDVSPTVDSGENSATYIEQATEWYADIVYLGGSNNYAGIIFIQKY